VRSLAPLEIELEPTTEQEVELGHEIPWASKPRSFGADPTWITASPAILAKPNVGMAFCADRKVTPSMKHPDAPAQEIPLVKFQTWGDEDGDHVRNVHVAPPSVDLATLPKSDVR
jgi:hypothetical protein